MVSTRRTAHIEPAAETAEPHLSNTLRKKPVRRATAKKAETQAAARTTRGRKAAPSPRDDSMDDLVEAPVPALQAKPMRRGPGRPKKEAQQTTNEEPAAPPAKTTRAMKVTASKNKRAEVRMDEESTEPAQTEPQATRRTRATAPKAQPLSPKKITQVLKAPTRNTKAAVAKIKPGRTAVTKSTTGTRKRAVSDENEDVPVLTPDAEDDDDVTLLSGTPAMTASPRKSPAKTSAPSEASMSSRPTTPSQSPAPEFDNMQDANEYTRTSEDDDMESINGEPETFHAQGVPSEDHDNEEIVEPNEASDDELCGPKTPMKRSSPGAEARYRASVQKSIRYASESPLAYTPIQRRSLATPRTALPYQKPTVPQSSERAMTVARGKGRAVVFTQESACESIGEQASPLPSQGLDNTNVHVQADEPVASHDSEQDNSMFENMQDYEHEQDVTVASALSSPAHDLTLDHADPEETIVVHDADSEDDDDTLLQGGQQPAESFELDDTVLVSRGNEHDPSDSETHSEESDSRESHSPTPETIIWENIRQDVTIPLNFDGQVSHSGVRAADLAEDFASIDGSPMPTFSKDVFAIRDEGDDEDDDMADIATPVKSRRSVDSTVNLNDFIDLGALAEPTQAIDFARPEQSEEQDAQVNGDETVLANPEAKPATVEDVEDSVMQFHEDLAAVELPIYDEEPAGTDQDQLHESVDEESEVPHYAMPTIAFDARRKSLPAISYRTPVKAGSRPTTSDGATAPRLRFTSNWAVSTPARHFALGNEKVPSLPATPRDGSDKVVDRPGTSTPPRNGTSMSSATATPVAATQERYPRLTPRPNYEAHANTAVQPSRFRTPAQQPTRRPATTRKRSADAMTPRASSLRPRAAHVVVPSTPEVADHVPQETSYTHLAPRANDEPHANTVTQLSRFRTPTQQAAKRPATAKKHAHDAVTPRASSLRPRAAPMAAVAATPELATPESTESPTPAIQATPLATPSERFPRLKPRVDYEAHAKTVAAPRFQTPVRSPVKQPSTVQKHGSLRKVAFKNSTPMSSHTPVKTPLKAPAMTPGQVPMTPHPSAPLKSVVAMVEVFTLEGASASAPFNALLRRLGASTTRAWNDRVTHVIFKDGSPTTLQRVRLHNKEVEETGKGVRIHCVNSRWVSDCDAEGKRMDEDNEIYTVDVAEVPRGGHRRRKSMEPSALVNLGGNIVRERKSSLSRSSLGRSVLNSDSPEKTTLDAEAEKIPKMDLADKENAGDETSSPVTPAYLAAPDKLVQQTAPINRMRKFGSKTKDAAKFRRLTYFNGAA